MAKSTAKTRKQRPASKLNVKDLATKKEAKVVGGAVKLPDNWARSGPCGS